MPWQPQARVKRALRTTTRSGLLAIMALAAFAGRPAAADPPSPPGMELATALRRAAANLPKRTTVPQQQSGWQAVAMEGATCGRGAPFKYYFNPASQPDAGLFILLSGGGACLKDGPAPEGTTGVARSLYCMDFENFQDPAVNDQYFTGALSGLIVPTVLPHFNRNDAANPFRAYHFVAVPYCTGDVFAGRMTAGYDYDPDPAASFDVTHRGHLNLMAVLEDLQRRVKGDVPVVLSGLSAGGFGAVFNFPEVIERWPRAMLLPDSGMAPEIPGTLFDRQGPAVAARWGADALLPDWCKDAACLATQRLLAAHAEHFDGRRGPWRPFGYLQSQQDNVLTPYLETTPCGYEIGLRAGFARQGGLPNLRAYLPATDKHVFSIVADSSNPLAGARPFVSKRGVSFLDWFRKVATAQGVADLPPDMVDPYLACHDIHLAALRLGP